MANLETLILRDIAASRPAAGIAGRLFYDTTNNKMQRDNGSSWEDVEPAGAGGSDSFKTIQVSGQSDVVADSPTDTLTLAAGSGVAITTNAGTDTITVAATGAAETFKTIQVSGQSDVVADSPTDTLTLVAGTNVTITTNAGTDTITIAASGGGADILSVQIFS